MKSTIEMAEKEQNFNYPCIKQSETTKTVILFTEPKKGFVLNCSTGTYTMGSFYEDWDEKKFKPLNGRVILENN